MVDLQFITLALASAVVSVTITQSYLFEWFREWLEGQPNFFYKLFTCSYCFGHWTSLFLILTFYEHHTILWFFVSWFALTGCSAIISGLIGKLYE